jgi:hypothetical protein
MGPERKVTGHGSFFHGRALEKRGNDEVTRLEQCHRRLNSALQRRIDWQLAMVRDV